MSFPSLINAVRSIFLCVYGSKTRAKCIVAAYCHKLTFCHFMNAFKCKKKKKKIIVYKYKETVIFLVGV